MAQDGILIPFGAKDCRIRKILSDPDGGSATYGPWLDVPGIQSVSLSPDFLEKELRGDNKVLDQYAKIQSISGSLKFAKESFAVLELIMGGTVSDSGSTPNEVRTLRLTGSDNPSYFQLELQVDYKGGDDASGGDFHLVLYKVKATKFAQEYQSEEYATLSMDIKAIPMTANDYLCDFVENETAVALTTGSADTTAPTCTTSPADAATGVAVSTSVVATFSEDLQASTVSGSSAYVFKASDGAAVAAAVTLVNNDASTTITINPDSNLEAATDYIAVFSTEIRDLAGNKLAANKVVNFQTA